MDTNTTFHVELIASAIHANCEAYHKGGMARARWSAEQDRLWKMAADQCIAADVLRLVCPSLVPAADDTDRAPHDAECACDDCRMERARDTAEEYSHE